MSTPAMSTCPAPPLSVMFVHAQPDDETTGARIARYAAAEARARVSLVTCTRNEQGELVDPDAHRATLTRYGALARRRRPETQIRGAASTKSKDLVRWSFA